MLALDAVVRRKGKRYRLSAWVEWRRDAGDPADFTRYPWLHCSAAWTLLHGIGRTWRRTPAVRLPEGDGRVMARTFADGALPAWALADWLEENGLGDPEALAILRGTWRLPEPGTAA